MNAISTGHAPDRRSGLRERKKARLRAEIRDQALRLFVEQGYEATTVQQVAEAAEISLSTLFRYFPTKAQLVLSTDLATLVRDARGRASPSDTVFDSIHAALRTSFDDLSRLSATGDPDDARILYTLARAREALLGEATGMVGLFAELIGEDWGRDPHDPLVQAAAGGVVGIGIAAWTADRDLGREAAFAILARGMRALEAGFRP